MPIDYRGLVDGLGSITAQAPSASELEGIEALVSTLRRASGAAAATFTEYGASGGRVVVAQGTMAWALGQPVSPTLATPQEIEHPYSGWVESMPLEVAQPLLARGIVALVGHPVRSADRAVGSLHLYFAEFAEPDWAGVTQVLRVAAAFADRVYSGREATPFRSSDEEDDRSLFLAVAGHELRTPVTVIKGYASLLADRWDSLDDDQRRSAARVMAQRADELAHLVDRLLGTSAGDASAGGLVRTVPFDPLHALLLAATVMPAQLRRCVRLELPNWLPPACGDPDVIGTVLTELVTNAVRASGEGRDGQLLVDLTAGADSDTVFIRVLDRGIGIDPSNAERAFERFWRAAATGSGVGLGLYLVRRLVERQNGWVSLRPRDGGGTIAEIRLARADGPPDESGATRRVRQVASSAGGEVLGAW
jgi:signal transduction histidine kinase